MSLSSNKLLALHRRIKSDNPKSSDKLVVPPSYNDDLLLPSPQPPTYLQPELCNICREIDLLKVADGRLTYRNFYLNPKDQQCVLCDIILHYLQLLSKTVAQRLSFHMQGIRIYVEYRVLNVYCSNIRVPLGKISVSRSRMETPGPFPAISTTSLSRGKFMIEPSQLDMKLAEKWLHDCATNHQNCNIQKTELLEIYLIDVVHRRIVPKKSDARYLALSYVWGGANTFHLTKSNFEVLRQPGSLMEYFPHIPQVVRDAMRFTDQLNVQYLWCDSLCIIQDDPIHRDPQITHMNTVYRHAFATVVAMSGQSADDRLPGLSLGSRSSLQPIRLHRGVDLEPLPPSLELAMLSSQYESRAWTYQERILSARCLYFTHSQLYFQCRSSLRSENGESIHYVKRHLVNPLLEFETRPHTALDYFWLDFFRCYDLVVRTYTQRHLSHQYDKLRAFSGISTMFEESRAGAFQYGLPEAVLDLVLLWIPCGQITRVSSKKYDPSSCRDYIPSWSWAGWDGPVEHMSHQQDSSPLESSADIELPNLKSEISAFRVENGEKATVRSIRRSIGVPYQIVTYPAETYEQPIQSETIISGPELCFSAEAISVQDFHLREFEQYTISPPGQYADVHAFDLPVVSHHNKLRTEVCNSAERCVGLLMDSKSNCSWPANSAQFEFILLSRTKASIMNGEKGIRTSSGSFFSSVTGDLEDDWSVLNVMLIRWTNRGRHAERVAVGTMIESAWNVAGPFKKLIRLI